ncbi:mechanosensitive ion channel protein MscS [Pontibacter ramchanderi]|uniref:Uncharacterized protein n=1 Tax=Pontibacter ramchanderi TaxID=1179743 RepID=A0A2N3U8W9_9BACT|nr:mechanosensitive ion channel protein MscS [Pontibacter ramchanderi]PKV63192.1 hypothetical protein BD749_3031 [Pontibacter ramchanderi]
MLKKLFYAVLLGVGMAACLSDRDNTDQTATATDTLPDDGDLTTTTADPETSSPAADPANLVIARGRAGLVRIGMPIAELRSQAMPGLQIRDTTLQLEGQPYTAYVVSTTERAPGILVEQNCEPDCQVWRISIRDPHYKTAQGIGLGSKYSEVAQHFPISYTSMGEAGFVAVSEQAGLSFILDTSQLDQNILHKLKPEQVPANTLVRGILIY